MGIVCTRSIKKSITSIIELWKCKLETWQNHVFEELLSLKEAKNRNPNTPYPVKKWFFPHPISIHLKKLPRFNKSQRYLQRWEFYYSSSFLIKSITRNSVPCPTKLFTLISPPNKFTAFFKIDRPRPVPEMEDALLAR